MYNIRRIICFWNIEACQSILIDPKNKMMNIENEHNRSSLILNWIRDEKVYVMLVEFIFFCHSISHCNNDWRQKRDELICAAPHVLFFKARSSLTDNSLD